MSYVFFSAAAVFALLLIPFSAEAVQAAADGLKLFGLYVVPSLFPFIVCSNCMLKGGLLNRSGREAALPLPALALTAAVCGTPSAALMLNTVRYESVKDERSASVCCAVLNQAGPVFIISTLSRGFLKSAEYAPALCVSHYVPAFIGSLLLCAGWKRRLKFCAQSKEKSPACASRIVSESISDSVSVMLRIGGTIVFFRVIYGVFSGMIGQFSLPESISGSIMGVIEMTNGLKALSAMQTRLSVSLCAFLLSFGGLCIFMQSKLVFERLRALPYFLTKLVCALISGAVMWFWYPRFGVAYEVFSFTGERADSMALSPEGAAAFISFASSAALTLLLSFTLAKLKRKS